MKKLKGAVVGLGYWGPNLVRNFIKIPHVQIKTVCDVSETVIKKFKQEYTNISVSLNYKDILNDQEIDFVAIATPVKTHFMLSKQALLAGKHVLVEKPMTKTSKEAEELIKIAKNNNKKLMVGHTFVYAEAVKEIKKNIDRKSFGKFLYFDSARINLGRYQADANVVWDLAPHDLSILSYLLNDTPVNIQAMGSSHLSNNNIDIAHIFLTYKDNITAHIYVSWLSPVKLRTILIGGSKQMIKYDDIEPSEKIKIYEKSITLDQRNITPFSPIYRSGNILIPHMAQGEALYTQLAHFVDCIRKNKTPLTDMYEGLRVVRLLEAIDKAMEMKGGVIL